MIELEQKKVKLAQAIGQYDRWHIVKRGLFYRPNAKGYTGNSSEAWTLTEEEARKHEYLKGAADERVTIVRADLPNWPEDLNACHEAEKLMTREQCNKFNSLIMDLKPLRSEMNSESEKWSWHASADQRFEALYQTLCTQ